MGNRFSRRRETPTSNPESVATDQKTTKEPAKDSSVTQTQEVTKSENLDVVVEEEQVTPVLCLPSEECVSECNEAEPSAASGPSTEPALVVKEAPTPIQPEPQVSASKPSPPESVAEVPVPEPVPASNPDGDTELVQPISEPVPTPAEDLEQQTDQLTQESLLEPIVSSPPSNDLGVPDVTPSPAPIPVPDEPSDPTDGEKCQDSDETADNSMSEPEKSAETHLEKAMEVEVDELGSDVNEESFSETLKNLELRGNDLVSDLIPSDVKIPDDTPITDMSTSTELM